MIKVTINKGKFAKDVKNDPKTLIMPTIGVAMVVTGLLLIIS